MIFWFIAIAITAAACVALVYAGAGRMVNSSTAQTPEATDQFRALLDGIDADLASGKLDEEQARAAKGELAREMLRARKDTRLRLSGELGRAPVIVGAVAVAVIAFGIYGFLGRPDLPANPLADRQDVAAQSIDLDAAIASIEERLKQTPDDVRGWAVIGPAYMQLGRFDDAANAFRTLMDLSGETPELLTAYAEARLSGPTGAGAEDAIAALQKAAEDPTHARSRLYLAAEAMRVEDYREAERLWSAAIALAEGTEPWLAAARQGLVVAQNDGVDNTLEQQNEMIAAMVGGLSERLYASGGTIEEWQQLVQSYIVLDDLDNAQRAYDAAVVAYPLTFDRGELDSLALGAGLKLNGGTR
ncbi:c-type cytochrome biogenesis protein CcmI [Devosia sp. MC532]|uniref:c-type cytochrome biogenesis protein CcmI n=1 Tax=Devosia sp. MC532 TaxID=2799788 RepID=UPI0018F2B073|nr:c-type cytochrome biogenesis protein CcmI [Devosia sp. MC532]MBJ7578027.1 c-type cytochrome biogenesis protein CcmI [Devosia sp. MC532]